MNEPRTLPPQAQARTRPPAATWLHKGLTALLLTASFACSSDDEGASNDDASAASETGDAGTRDAAASDAAAGGERAVEPPDYAAAFPQDRVARLDIVVTADNWQIMRDDLTTHLGEFGAGMGRGPGGARGGPPQELIDACKDLAAGDTCTAPFMGMEGEGTCSALGPSLLCLPAGFPGGMGGMGPGGFGMGGTADLIGATPVYVECEVSTEDRAWSHVGLRFKGNSSLSMPWGQGVWKLPLRLQFDEFEDQYPETHNQRFYGFKNLSLANSSMDQSLLREKLGTDLFAHAGLPAAATAFYRVYLDHGEGPQYLGLYTGIELPSDKPFLESHFGSDEGNLYKPNGTGATWSTWVEASFEKKTNEVEADYSDVEAAYAALHADRSDAATWRAGLEAVFDVELFLHWLALNTVMQDWDHYGRMSHNYYLYANPSAEGRLQWIPWDHSFAFAPGQGFGGGTLPLDMAAVTETWPLIRFLLDDAHYRERYNHYVAQAAASEYTPEVYEARFRDAHALIAPYAVGEEGEQPGYTFLRSPEDFEQALEDLVEHVHARQAEVEAYLANEQSAAP